MNDGSMSDLSTRLSTRLSARLFTPLTHTLSRAQLRYGQAPARQHHGVLAVWLLCLGALLLVLWIWPAQSRIHTLETTLRARTIELHGLGERLREAQALTHALQAITALNTSPATLLATSLRSTQDPWPFLQGLTQARSVHLLDYTPLSADPERDCQPLRLKMNAAPIPVQALLQDLLRSPQSVERFTLTPDESGSTALSLQVCLRGTESRPVLTNTPTAALFQPVPKPARRPRTALEELPLSDYRVIAVGRAEHDHYALVRTPSGKTHTVRPGMPLGERGGQVIAVHPNGIEVQQDSDRLSLLIGSPP